VTPTPGLRSAPTGGSARHNQADHIALGRSVIDGARDAANRWVFRELLDEGLPPWRADRILAADSPLATHAAEVTATFTEGPPRWRRTRSTSAAFCPDAMSDPREFLEPIAASICARLSVAHAAAFEMIDF
jgi:hypothetical protein